jgi:hypothetical protein
VEAQAAVQGQEVAAAVDGSAEAAAAAKSDGASSPVPLAELSELVVAGQALTLKMERLYEAQRLLSACTNWQKSVESLRLEMQRGVMPTPNQVSGLLVAAMGTGVVLGHVGDLQAVLLEGRQWCSRAWELLGKPMEEVPVAVLEQAIWEGECIGLQFSELAGLRDRLAALKWHTHVRELFRVVLEAQAIKQQAAATAAAVAEAAGEAMGVVLEGEQVAAATQAAAEAEAAAKAAAAEAVMAESGGEEGTGEGGAAAAEAQDVEMHDADVEGDKVQAVAVGEAGVQQAEGSGAQRQEQPQLQAGGEEEQQQLQQQQEAETDQQPRNDASPSKSKGEAKAAAAAAAALGQVKDPAACGDHPMQETQQDEQQLVAAEQAEQQPEQEQEGQEEEEQGQEQQQREDQKEEQQEVLASPVHVPRPAVVPPLPPMDESGKACLDDAVRMLQVAKSLPVDQALKAVLAEAVAEAEAWNNRASELLEGCSGGGPGAQEVTVADVVERIQEGMAIPFRMPMVHRLHRLLEEHVAWEAAVAALVLPPEQPGWQQQQQQGAQQQLMAAGGVGGPGVMMGQRPAAAVARRMTMAEVQALADVGQASCMASELYEALDELLGKVKGNPGAGRRLG